MNPLPQIPLIETLFRKISRNKFEYESDEMITYDDNGTIFTASPEDIIRKYNFWKNDDLFNTEGYHI